jgi:Arc/MetJ-type ribon-helix-helix transcriptional regulator
MTIHLSKELESDILAVVNSGRYASLDDAMSDAASMLLERLKQEQAQGEPAAAARQPDATQERKPIWEVFQELSASVPAEVWDALPTDLSEQHDHYIYGTPKRPTA